MYIGLISFGKELRDIRIKLGLTQNDVSGLTGINTETLRRIEGGRVMPKFETLSNLSSVYKVDLNKLFLKYRLEDFDYIYELKNNLESKFDRDEFHTLNTELKKLNVIIGDLNN